MRLRSGDGTMLNAIAFRAAGQPLGQALLKSRGQAVHAAGTLSIDRWNGRRARADAADRRGGALTRGDARALRSAILAARTNTPSAEELPAMSKLNLSVAIGDYDRNRPLIDGAVQIDGVDPVFMKLYPEEIFFRAFRSRGLRHLRVLAVELHGEDRGGQLSLCRRAGLRVADVPPHLDLCAAPTASRSRRT